MTHKKTTVSLPFMLMGVLFCICLIAANLLETKQVTLGPLEMTAGLIVFPISYIINDCLVEVWGYRRARFVIWMGFLMNFLFVIFGLLADWLPAAPYWQGEEGFHAIFVLRQGGKHFSLRAIASTIVGEGADSLIFFPLALGGVVPWEVMPAMMLTQLCLKTAYEIIALPVTIRVVNYVKRTQGEDTFDKNISYSVWKISEL